jgi:AP-2 complex subunit alpha
MTMATRKTNADPRILPNRLKEYIKEHLIDLPRARVASPPALQQQPHLPPAAPATYNDPGAMLAGLL